MYKIIFFFMFSTTLWAYQNGDKVDLDIQHKMGIQEDKIYIIDFFASWCISCKHELPLIEKLFHTLDQKDIEILGVDVDEDISKAKAFQEDLKLSFRVLNDPKGEIVKHFDPVGMPAIYLVRGGKVVSMILGARDHVDKILAKELQKIVH